MTTFTVKRSLALATLVIGLFCSPLLWAQEKTPDFGAHESIAHLAEEMEHTWEESPQFFGELEQKRERFSRAIAFRRGSYIHFARDLEALGEEGFLPMVWALVNDNPFALGYDLLTWWNWRLALVEAIGRLEDHRSIPVLVSIIEGNDPHERTRRVATMALGSLLDEPSIESIIEHARQNQEHRRAILGGLGTARVDSARIFLLEHLSENHQGEDRRLAIRSLGDWSNQWAWETSRLANRGGDGMKGRQEIIAELIHNFSRFSSPEREEAIKSLQLAGSKMSLAYLERFLAEDSHQSENYETLHRRLERSPLP